MTCTRCSGTGFLNLEQMEDGFFDNLEPPEILTWIRAHPDGHDVCVCDCCGDGDSAWHGTPGAHYSTDDPRGPSGPYAYNGGLCECN